jgi:Gluconate 2-dehydrogenase subunit 3
LEFDYQKLVYLISLIIMDRRSAIKRFIIISAGVAIIPSCKSHPSDPVAVYNNIPVSAEQQELLASVAQTIIPSGSNSPGAKEVSATIFALQMLNDCYQQEDRDRFIKGLHQFQNNVELLYGRPFTVCYLAEKEKIVATANGRDKAKDEEAFFYHTFKQLTVEAYASSQYFLTNVQVYKLVPGKYISHVVV